MLNENATFPITGNKSGWCSILGVLLAGTGTVHVAWWESL